MKDTGISQPANVGGGIKPRMERSGILGCLAIKGVKAREGGRQTVISHGLSPAFAGLGNLSCITQSSGFAFTLGFTPTPAFAG
jgi:hypothetical protein